LIKAAIFDLDGVIVDTAKYHYLAWKRLARQLGFDLTEEDNEQLKGISRIHSMEIVARIGGLSLPEAELRRLANLKNEWFIEYIEQMRPDEVFPGVVELVKDLRARGIRIGLASSSKNAPAVLGILQITELFDVVVDGTMIIHSKPDPEIFLLAAERLGLPPEVCLVFEDAEAGVEAALRAGMRCVGIGSEVQLGKADMVLARTGDFTIDMIQRIG
jgi:beta-phosphoglucomutase